MENKKETKKEKIMQVIDVFFVMILCFVVLLVTMLFQNLAGVKEAGKAYVIQASTLVPVVVALAAYVTFLVKRSKKDLKEIIYVFLTIFLYLLKCPQSLILSALRAFCFCGKPHISRSIFLYFRYQAWLKSW